MLTPDDIAKEFEQTLLSKSEEERIKYLKKLGFSITSTKVAQRVGVKAATINTYGNIAGKSVKYTVKNPKKKTGTVAGRVQTN